MQPRDARKLSAEALEDLRRRVVAAVESGVPQGEAAYLFGVSRQTVSAWVQAYRRQGDEALRPRRRGRRPGDKLALSCAQQLWTVRTLATHTPEEVGLHHSLWSRQALAELIRHRFHMTLSTSTIRNYLIRWGLLVDASLLGRLRSPQTIPTDHMSAADEPGTPAPPRTSGAEALWTGWVRMDRRLWAPLGMEAAPTHEVHTFFLFAVSSRGAVSFIPTADPYDGAHLRDFFDRLTRHYGRRLTIVHGWPPRYRADLLSAWMVMNAGTVSVEVAGVTALTGTQGDVSLPNRAE
jgi:transposase